jgi:hypothetical protein
VADLSRCASVCSVFSLELSSSRAWSCNFLLFFVIFTSHGGCKILVANRRGQLIEWMNALLPEFSLPPDSSDEELRELLSDGVVLCRVANTLIPGVLEASPFFFLDNVCVCGDNCHYGRREKGIRRNGGVGVGFSVLETQTTDKL